MNFGQALEALKKGERVRRNDWHDNGMWLQLQMPDKNSKMTQPYIYINYPIGYERLPNGSRVPWVSTQTDILSEDWETVE